ncbi:hypothetical protein [Streptomyces niveus]|uniref:hypothetical protein n=1 Tax=Streptomyces niveus TaxID=193462 RepID=UPI001495C3CE
MTPRPAQHPQYVTALAPVFDVMWSDSSEGFRWQARVVPLAAFIVFVRHRQPRAPALCHPQHVAQDFGHPRKSEPEFTSAYLRIGQYRLGAAQHFGAHTRLHRLHVVREPGENSLTAVGA